ncbi:epidermal growth factor-like protein 7 isoform 6-T6 [Rhynochetos jubatus]
MRRIGCLLSGLLILAVTTTDGFPRAGVRFRSAKGKEKSTQKVKDFRGREVMNRRRTALSKSPLNPGPDGSAGMEGLCRAAGSVPRCRRAAWLPTPSPTSSRSTSPTSPLARTTASAAPTGPSTGLPTGRRTGSCLRPRPRAVPVGGELMATRSAATELSAGCRARTAGAASSPADAPARPAGWGKPARQTWMSVPARATDAVSSASTRPGATAAPARMASTSLPTTRPASPWGQPLSQSPSAKQVPPVKLRKKCRS